MNPYEVIIKMNEAERDVKLKQLLSIYSMIEKENNEHGPDASYEMQKKYQSRIDSLRDRIEKLDNKIKLYLAMND